MIWAASSAKDYRLVIQTVDERIATGRVSGADLQRKLRLKATTHYSLREYREAAATLDKLAAAGGLNTDDLILLGNSQVALKSYGPAAATLEKALAAAEKAKKPAAVTSKLLLGLHRGLRQDRQRRQENADAASPDRGRAERRIFKWVASAYEVQSQPGSGCDDQHLRWARHGVCCRRSITRSTRKPHSTSRPGEAVAMLEKGMANGAIKKDDRNNRLLTDAKGQVERVKAGCRSRKSRPARFRPASRKPRSRSATSR